MSDSIENMSDADLDAVIFDTSSEQVEDSGVSNDNSVSPTIEDSDEQPNEDEVVTDVDQSINSDEDSTDDSTDDDQNDDSDPDTDDLDNEANDTDTTDDEDKGTETDDNKSETTEKFQALKANGKEYPIDSIDELYKLASAGVGAQQKYQAIAGHKKSIMAADKAGVDIMDAVNFQANYNDNPIEVIKQLIKDNNLDPLDIDLENIKVSTKDRSVSDFEVGYDEIVGEIGNSPIFKDVENVILNKWDQESRDIFLQDPSMIKNLHEEMSPMKGSDKSMFDLVSPIAEKMKLSGDKRSDFDVYMDARGKKVAEFQKHEDAVNKAETKKPVKKPKAEVNKKKKAAAPTGGKSTGKPSLDFATMSDKELDAFLAKTN